MTPDDPTGEGPTQPLPIEPDAGASPTEPVVAPHVPVADLSTAPLDPVDTPAAAASRDRSRALTWGLIAAVLLFGIAVIVVLTMYFQGQEPGPTLSPAPSLSPTVSPTPSEVAPAPGDDAPSEAPVEPPPAPEPTPTPEPTVPPDPDPTGTPAAPAG
jgi:hypothetical protein